MTFQYKIASETTPLKFLCARTRLHNSFYLEELGKGQDCEQYEEVGTDSDDEDDTAADQQEPLKLKSYKEAVIALEEVSQFLEYKGHGDEALSMHGYTIDRIVNLKHASARQITVTTLHDYFNH